MKIEVFVLQTHSMDSFFILLSVYHVCGKMQEGIFFIKNTADDALIH